MSSSHSAELTPLALTILGLDRTRSRSNQAAQNDASVMATHNAEESAEAPQPRIERRSTAYHNTFQTKVVPSFDDPPSYSVSASLQRIPRSTRFLDGGNEILPKYTCTVAKEGVMSMHVEKLSPFQFTTKQEWRTVYVVLRGTQLSVHKVKTSSIAGTSVSTAGKLLRSYTLQHAEVGLAADTTYYVLVPQTKLAQFIPVVARRRAYEKDPAMFKPVRQCVMRLRLETDQIVLAERSEQQIFSWIHKISAGIDIAPPIDDRAAPKQCTVPRRRRRQRLQITDALTDSRMVEQQEAILRRLYPGFAEAVPATGDASQEPAAPQTTDDATPALEAQTPVLPSSMEQDGEDIDLAALAEDTTEADTPGSRPAAMRRITTSSFVSGTSSSGPYRTNPRDLDRDGKWAPFHPGTIAQQWRYIRRCVPVLLHDSPRASNIVFYRGERLRINSRMDMLEEWALAPPSYDAHNFPTTSLRRAITRTSTVDSASLTPSASTSDARMSPSSDNELDITVVASLAKSRSRASSEAHKRGAATLAPTQRIAQIKNEQPSPLEPGLVLFGY